MTIHLSPFCVCVCDLVLSLCVLATFLLLLFHWPIWKLALKRIATDVVGELQIDSKRQELVGGGGMHETYFLQ